jgi:putative tryptophan/tyrosine transport system substrate-binding protein
MAQPDGLILKIEVAAAAALCVGLGACGKAPVAAPPGPVIAFLSSTPAPDDVSFKAFSKAWRTSASGSCANAELRHVHAEEDNYPAMSEAAKRAERGQPSVLVAPTELGARAAREATSLPLIFASYLNPVRSGLVSTEGPRPENVTGISLDDRLLSKRLEILREAFPWVRKIGLIVDDAWRVDSNMDQILADEHEATGLDFYVGAAEAQDQLPALFAARDAQDVDAWYIPPTEIGYLAEAQILEHLRQAKAPAVHATVAEVKNGALMAYAQDISFVFDALASLTNRVCNGEPAGSIPVERPRRFILAIRSQYDLGKHRIAPSVAARADQIE